MRANHIDLFHFQSKSEFGIVNNWLSRTHRLTFNEQDNHLIIRPHTQQPPTLDSKYPYGHGWIIEKIDDNSNQSCRFKHLYHHSIDIDEQQHFPILSKIELNKQSQYFIIESSKHPRYLSFVRIRNVANNLYLSVQKPSDVAVAVDCSLQTYNVTLREGNSEHDETQYWKIRDLNLVNQPFLVYQDGVDHEVQYGVAILKKVFPQMQLLLDPLIFHSSSQNVDGWRKNGMEIMSKSYPLSEIILLSHCSVAGKISNTRTMDMITVLKSLGASKVTVWSCFAHKNNTADDEDVWAANDWVNPIAWGQDEIGLIMSPIDFQGASRRTPAGRLYDAIMNLAFVVGYRMTSEVHEHVSPIDHPDVWIEALRTYCNKNIFQPVKLMLEQSNGHLPFPLTSDIYLAKYDPTQMEWIRLDVWKVIRELKI
ncbi:unnamed protein product [Rotaria socialis]|uniref:Uncharacterized protein n=1 Tax=Rotaria socialis TaxID=392032 RepID=A0A817U0I9_9BILA|nr:unnamed protein product [Rotaria socialis]CAF3437832.1 unnamed protein product [Rotaria socialis]CAF4173627.1 unnamed protein product [Rotaria socialis]CAF4499506.1 unnamed protein product [Rotaria socialis]